MDEEAVRARAQALCEAIVAGDIDRAIEDFSKELRQHLGEVIALLPLPASEATIESIEHSGSGRQRRAAPRRRERRSPDPDPLEGPRRQADGHRGEPSDQHRPSPRRVARNRLRSRTSNPPEHPGQGSAHSRWRPPAGANHRFARPRVQLRLSRVPGPSLPTCNEVREFARSGTDGLLFIGVVMGTLP